MTKVTRTLAAVSVAAALVVAGACSSDDDESSTDGTEAPATDGGGSTGSTLAGGGGDEVVEVSGDATVEATVGETVTISLEANETTGYRWSEAVDGNAVRSAGGEYQAPSGGALGAGGTQLYRYEAVEAGTATVTLTYAQVGSGDVGQTYVVTFDVS